MAFSVGDRLGRFEILGALGAGGMGEVYRARDPHLQREVAIKVLPPAFLDDADRRRRFEQEARAAGGLNHPNILAVFDIGIEGSSLYMVTELLAGETLRERMGDRPLPAHKATDYALQIASGLAAAHDRGVVHRDIKPENVFVTTDGRIKILDFGIAKLVGPDASGSTEAIAIDDVQQTHVVIGTVAYMSPEQARGLRIDHRTDIFSFGVVLYEMLAGFPPFRRGTTADTLNAILHDEPTKLPAGDAAIPALDHVARHCLEKRPEERFQNFRDLAFHLRAQPNEAEAAAKPVGGRGRSRRAALVGGGIVALAAAAVLGAFAATRFFSTAPAAPYRVRPLTSLVGLEESSAISPDGKMVALTASEGERRQIFIRYLTDRSNSLLRVTSDPTDHQLPRWTPDGSSLLYFSPGAPGEVQGTIYRIPAFGGPFQRVMASIGGGDVSGHGRLVCFRLEKERIQLITATLDGSDVQLVTELPTRHYGYPRWSPDNQTIAFAAGDGFRWDIHVVSASPGSTPTKITNDAKVIKGLSWLPDGSGVIHASARASTFPYLPPLALWEVLLDGRQRQVTTPEASYEQPDLDATGLLSATRLRMRYEIWKYAFGEITPGVERGQRITRQTGQVATPSASPDGNQVAYLSDDGGHANVWVASKNGSPRQITFEDDPGVAIGVPAWSPDGQWIAYLSSKGNVGLEFGMRLVKPDASENHPLVPKGLSPVWSEDSKWIYYVESSNTSIKRISVAGGIPEPVRAESARNIIGVRGSTVYYLVDRALTDGRQQFEVRSAPIGAGPVKNITTIPVSRVPSWQVVNPALSPDGKWLAVPLTDGFTTNIWAISTEDPRTMKRVTDFGDRAIFITRRVCWSHDGRSILGAIGEGDADIVLLDGLIKGIVK